MFSNVLKMTEMVHVNMFAGSPLNRMAWLRTSHVFLNAMIKSQDGRWLLFNLGQPLMAPVPADSSPKQSIAILTTEDVKPFLGQEPYFGQGQNEGDLAPNPGDGKQTEGARHLGVPVVFLGVHEPSSETGALPSAEFANPEAALANLKGTPYFAMDVADLELTTEQLDEVLKASSLGQRGEVPTWCEPRVLMTGLDRFTGAIFAEARSLTDWNLRNKFCPGCGRRAYSMWGGWKLACSSLLPWAENAGQKPCLSSKGLHNFCHPRTDPVVIMLAVDSTGEKVLLGRGKRFPGRFYSALAGFVEPGESFEDAVVREMWEEAGVTVWDAKYHSGQPWPYPANLMVGFYSRADASQPIRTDLDNELVDARWFTREEIFDVLGHPIGEKNGRPEFRKKEQSTDLNHFQANPVAEKAENSTSAEEPIRLPPDTAIAGVLIRDWAAGKIQFPREEQPRKVNL